MYFCGRFGQEQVVVVKCGRAQRFEPMLIIWGKLSRPVVQVPGSSIFRAKKSEERKPLTLVLGPPSGEIQETLLGHMSCLREVGQSGRPGIPSMLPFLKFLQHKLLTMTPKHCVWRWCVWNLVLYHESGYNIHFLHWRSHDLSETQQFF